MVVYSLFNQQTGYFTSRPTSKGYIRKATSFLQAARQIEALVGESSSHTAPLCYLEESVALAQHHDAITGTAKQHVVNDYHERLARGTHCCCSLHLEYQAIESSMTLSLLLK